jgi:hypothetical protein
MRFTEKQAEALIAAVRSIGNGDVHGPGGLEALGIAIAGEGLRQPLAETLSAAIFDHAEAVRELAEAINVCRDVFAAKLPGGAAAAQAPLLDE